MTMEYNKCKTCGAGDGRAGFLINGNCLNCYDTIEEGRVILHPFLERKDKENYKTIKIISDEQFQKKR